MRDQLVETHEQIPHGLLRELEAVALPDALLAVQGQVIRVLGRRDVRVDRRVVLAAIDDAWRSVGGHHAVAGPAGVLLAFVAGDDELGRYEARDLRAVDADRVHLPAAVGADALFFGHVELDDLTREVVGEGRPPVPGLLGSSVVRRDADGL